MGEDDRKVQTSRFFLLGIYLFILERERRVSGGGEGQRKRERERGRLPIECRALHRARPKDSEETEQKSKLAAYLTEPPRCPQTSSFKNKKALRR